MSKKFGIISYPDSRNKGDEIQSIAAGRQLPQIDYLVPRNGVNTFESNNNEEVNLICNGWFTTDKTAWPPSNIINPLFVSFHASHYKGADAEIISEKHIPFYKQNEPIGCRDYDTKAKLEKIGIEAFFSGCITLTLDNPFGEDVERDEILIVEPFIMFKYDQKYVDYCLDILVPEKYRSKVKLISHWRDKGDATTIDGKFKESEALLERYAKAKLVITSRIHCALPCLAMGTPVYFMDMGYNSDLDRNRFKGIIDLFNVIDDSYFPMNTNSYLNYGLRKLGLYKVYKRNKETIAIDWEDPKPNPVKYKEYRKNIKKLVKEFIEK